SSSARCAAGRSSMRSMSRRPPTAQTSDAIRGGAHAARGLADRIAAILTGRMARLSPTAASPCVVAGSLSAPICDVRTIRRPLPSAMNNQFDRKSEAWSALFSEPTSELVKRYTASVSFDRRLWRADIAGSRAHARMLAMQGVIGAADLAAIETGLTTVAGEIESGRFEWRADLEDVHMNIEARLIELAGDAGKRLHTGRSRNDQVATDVRLWLRE